MSATAPYASKRSLCLLFPLFFAAVALSHITLLRLPYFWDEGGYYIPAALDLFHTGSLIPYSTVTNAHPPLPSLLLAGWWHLVGCTVLSTRILVCLVASAALLGVYRLCRSLADETTAVITTLLTAIYPIWFAQSTLAHADIFAAAFTLWALSVYLPTLIDENSTSWKRSDLIVVAALFSLAALAKETAVITPLVLAAWEATKALRKGSRAIHLRWFAALSAPVLPLLAWYGYHRHKTGFTFGNPEFLRYNATANLGPLRILLSLWHRLLHLTAHMNMFVPVACTVAVVLLIPALRPRLPRAVCTALGVVLIANWLEFSILGGALLTRYLLPLYPVLLLLCVVEWRRRLPRRGMGWMLLSGISVIAFLTALWVNPPYIFAPEDNLTYRNMVVVHQQAIAFLEAHYPQATILTAWPATSELERPEIGYTHHPFRVMPIQNFSFAQLQKASTEPGSYDTALIFSTKWEPPPSALNLGRMNESADIRYFDYHHDLHPSEAAALLHGEIVWQTNRGGEWAAILHFPRIVEARLTPAIIP